MLASRIPKSRRLPSAALLAGAVVWGLIWYPYRVVEAAGMGGVTATLITYGLAFLLGLLPLWPVLRRTRPSIWLFALGLMAAGTNLGYVLGALDGEVMRVLLLFYLSPLWTVLLSRVMLGERLSRTGAGVIALSLGGAMVMLWQPALGLPWPQGRAEWLGLMAGVCFAAVNVMVRRTAHIAIEQKVMAVFLGVVAVAPVAAWLRGESPLEQMAQADAHTWAVLFILGGVLLLVNLVVQYGITFLAANAAIALFLFELVVAAISSWWLAGEMMGVKEWIGGAMIIAASLFSGHLETATPDRGSACSRGM
ncbi:DMT family transporter [Methyloversatilis thermotolerans]|uniref:DMT family transporter n=1 Tax=Methyloversatilis thermotolerans TaxID=1346290 RepID=UPI00036F17AA|nr:DMT family transporter [Methyloversatilis thermotolerans]